MGIKSTPILNNSVLTGFLQNARKAFRTGKYLFVMLVFLYQHSFAQKDSSIIKLEATLKNEQNPAIQLELIEKLAQKTNYQNPEQCKAYLDKGIVLAEQSRQRELMVKARIIAATAYLGNGGIQERTDEARKYAQEALALCTTENDISYTARVACNTLMARIERYSGKATLGLTYNQEAITLANESNNDSLKVEGFLSNGNTLLFLDENLKAFKSYLAAQEIAEKSKQKNAGSSVNAVYSCFVNFYTSIENYEKAIDYQYKYLQYAKDNKKVIEQIGTLNAIGANYTAAKKYDAAKAIYAEMKVLTDSIHEEAYTILPTLGVLNTLLLGEDKSKGLAFLQNHPEINAYFQKIGMSYLLDRGYAVIYHSLQMKDSANFYYEKALPVINKKGSIFGKIDICYQYGYHLYSTGNYPKAINILTAGKILCDTVKNPSTAAILIEILDSCYQKMGDYKNAYLYAGLYKKTKDALNEKSKAKDVLSLEIDAENKRKERLAREEEENTQKRHNWQYMGIVMGIIALFTLLAAVGIFNVPIKWVRALGFIAFIFLFEFIILLADTWIHHATQGEPWKVLGIKVILIAMLLPLHHFLEHKAIEFITHRRKNRLMNQGNLQSVPGNA